MKKKKLWTLVIAGICIIILVALAIVFPVILKKSWKWFWIPSIVIGAGWLIYGIVILIILSNKGDTIIPKIATREIEKWHIERIMDNEYIADNFILKDREVGNFGDPAKGITPVLLMIGYLTEKEQDMAIIINLNNPKEQYTDKFNINKDEIRELKEIIADNPDKTIKEDIKLLNAFGNQFGNIHRTVPSSQKERDELNQQKIGEDKSL